MITSAPEIVICEFCNAGYDEPCTTASGEVATEAHRVRRRAAALHDDGRAVYHAETIKRWRTRNAMYALGFERVTCHSIRYEEGHLLPLYSEVFEGELGRLTIEWI